MTVTTSRQQEEPNHRKESVGECCQERESTGTTEDVRRYVRATGGMTNTTAEAVTAAGCLGLEGGSDRPRDRRSGGWGRKGTAGLEACATAGLRKWPAHREV